jgi:hypothetical protein
MPVTCKQLKSQRHCNATNCLHSAPLNAAILLAFITDFLEAGSFVRQFTQGKWEMWKKSPSQEGKRENYGQGLIGWTEKKKVGIGTRRWCQCQLIYRGPTKGAGRK